MDKQSSLNKEEIERYDRHLRLQDFGVDKQLKLKQAKVLIVGAGGLGCPIALYLAASGIGKIAIADGDKIELSNLQRQIAFCVNDIGKLKAEILAHKLEDMNPLIDVLSLPMRIDASNVESIISNYDLVIDGTDNFVTRFLIADACYLAKISYLHAAVHKYQGQISLFLPEKTACFRCLFRQPPLESALPPCAEAGVLGVVTGVIGSLAAAEAIKYIAKLGQSIAGHVLIYDVVNAQSKKFVIERDENCPLCTSQTSTKTIKSASAELNSCMERMQINDQVISITEAHKLLQQNDPSSKIILLDVREEHEFERGHLDNAKLWPLSIMQTMPSEAIKLQLQNQFSGKKNNNGANLLVICYCQKGSRSLKALSLLRETGITNVFSLEGGIEAWLNRFANLSA